MCLFDGDIPLNSEKGNGGFRGWFFETRVGGREEHLISPQLTCARWVWLSAVHRLCHEFPQKEQNTFCVQHPGGQMKVFKGRTGRSRQVAAFMFYHSYITVAPPGQAGTRLPGTTLMSDCFSHPVFQLQMVSDYKETSSRVTRLYKCTGAKNSDGTVTYFSSLIKESIKRKTRNLSFERFQSTNSQYLFQLVIVTYLENNIFWKPACLAHTDTQLLFTYDNTKMKWNGHHCHNDNDLDAGKNCPITK